MTLLMHVCVVLFAIAIRDFIKGDPPCTILGNIKIVDCSNKGLTSLKDLNLPSSTKGWTLDVSENYLDEIPASYIARFEKIDLRNNPACSLTEYRSFDNVICGVYDKKTGAPYVEHTTQLTTPTSTHTVVTINYKDIIITITSASQLIIAVVSAGAFFYYIRNKFIYIARQLTTLYNIYRRQFAVDFEADDPVQQPLIELAAGRRGRARVQIPRRQQPARPPPIRAPQPVVHIPPPPPQRPIPPPPQEHSIASRVRAKNQQQRGN